MTQNKFWLLQRDTGELGAGVTTASLNQTLLFHRNLLEFRGRFPVFALLLVASGRDGRATTRKELPGVSASPAKCEPVASLLMVRSG